MLRLSGQDAYFLYQETQTTPMHTLKILVGRPTGARAPGFAETRQAIAASLDAIPGFRRRIVWVPLGLHHPVAIEDPEFDINLHVHRLAVPAPGGSSELDEVIAQVSSFPLDRSRPLWELWVVEGLQDGRLAYVVKVHHAIADGRAAVNQLERILGSGKPGEHGAAAGPWQPEPIPSVSRLIVDALRDQVRDIGRLPGLLGKTLGSLHKIYLRIRAKSLDIALPGNVPPTPFNRSLCGQRDFASVRFALADFRAIRDGLGGTVNDAVLAVAAGALRDYLVARNRLPDRPLVASVPAAGVEDDGRQGTARPARKKHLPQLGVLYPAAALHGHPAPESAFAARGARGARHEPHRVECPGAALRQPARGFRGRRAVFRGAADGRRRAQHHGLEFPGPAQFWPGGMPQGRAGPAGSGRPASPAARNPPKSMANSWRPCSRL